MKINKFNLAAKKPKYYNNTILYILSESLIE
jgi:hypothetical protein